MYGVFILILISNNLCIQVSRSLHSSQCKVQKLQQSQQLYGILNPFLCGTTWQQTQELVHSLAEAGVEMLNLISGATAILLKTFSCLCI